MKKSFVSKPLPLIFVLTDVWLILLALCAVIWKFIVPISTVGKSYPVVFVISAFKVGSSLFFILIWLIGWYKALQYLLAAQFYQSLKDSTDDKSTL